MFKEPLALLVFMHKDLAGYNKDDLYDKHFSWLVDEMENISGRKMLVRLISPSEAQDLSDHPYENYDESASLREWATKVSKHNQARPRKGLNPKFNKYLLLTRYPINSQVLGVAYRPGSVGIASIEKTGAAAHEVGHMFNATHEDGEILYNGWWSETIMTPSGEFTRFRSDAERFSDKNRKNIRNYLNGPIIGRAAPNAIQYYDDGEV